MAPKTKHLQQLIYNSFTSSAMIPLIVIELLLLLLYFGINHYISSRHQQALLAEVTTSLQEVSSREAASIDNQLKDVSRHAIIMQRSHEHFFRSQKFCDLPNGEPQFASHENGAFYKINNNGGSSLYYSSTTAIGPEELRKARCSEVLDPILESIVNSNPIISQAYLNTWDNMNRLYPFMTDAPAQYGPTLKMADYNFYFEADAKHNPARKPVWTGAYLDPAGQGWMISVVVPIYREDFLEGVSGIDVTIESFIKHVLDLKMSWDGKAFLLDNQGVILAMPESVASLFGMAELTRHEYSETIKQTIEKPKEYNIFAKNESSLKTQLKQMFDSRARVVEISIDGAEYLVSQEIVPETDWRLITLVDKKVIFARIIELKTLSNMLGYAAIAIMAVFYAAFFLFLRNKSIRMASMISRPIELLTAYTSKINDRLQPFAFKEVGITELDVLGRNFSEMSEELEKRTHELVESQIRERSKDDEVEKFELLATTDRLTGIYNRHKLDFVLQAELDRSQRNERNFGIMLLDIDHFKRVNDTYGHQIGDQILKDLASLLKTNIRNTDTLGRWGGEEFLLICPETNAEGLFNLAEKLRGIVERHVFSIAKHNTISFGIAMNQPADSIADIISRADKALYTAKNEGRNRVEMYSPVLH